MAVPPVAARDARFAPCRLGPSPPSEIICHRVGGCIKAGAKILQKIAQNPAANLIRAFRFFTQPLTDARRRQLGVGYGNAHAREAPHGIASAAKIRDTEVTAIQLGWTCQIAIKDRGMGVLNKGLFRDDRTKRSEPGAI